MNNNTKLQNKTTNKTKNIKKHAQLKTTSTKTIKTTPNNEKQ